MNNQENGLALLENIQIGEPSKAQPEQSAQVERHVFRPISFVNLIHQWQPMGIRITIQIPFIGNDRSYLFLVRNTPFIPNWTSNVNVLGFNYARDVYFYNNTRNVYLGVITDNTSNDVFWTYPNGYNITYNHYDHPPPLATLSNAFRKWRGGMQYRFRQVANFATQGYPFVTILKNTGMPVGIYNEYRETPVLNDLDGSYREGMMNAYVPCDTGMFRHLEVSVPWEYPVPYYDHYQWLINRITGDFKVSPDQSEVGYSTSEAIVEPFGDNWVAVGLRGSIDSTKEAASAIQFELEYRAMEDFQFADPGLPMASMALGITSTNAPANPNNSGNSTLKQKLLPNEDWLSNGLNRIIQNSPSVTVNSMANRMAKVLNTSFTTGDVQPLDPGVEGLVRSTTTSKPALYSECTYDSRSGEGYTYCKVAADGTWKAFKGDKRDRFTRDGKYVPTRITRSVLTDADVASAHYNMRMEERQF